MAFVTTILPAEVPSIAGIEEVDVREEHTTRHGGRAFHFSCTTLRRSTLARSSFATPVVQRFYVLLSTVFPNQDFTGLATEEAVFARAGIQFIPPELREDETYLDRAVTGDLPELIEVADVRGIVHKPLHLQ